MEEMESRGCMWQLGMLPRGSSLVMLMCCSVVVPIRVTEQCDLVSLKDRKRSPTTTQVTWCLPSCQLQEKTPWRPLQRSFEICVVGWFGHASDTGDGPPPYLCACCRPHGETK